MSAIYVQRTLVLIAATLALAQGQIGSDVPSDVPSASPSDLPSSTPSGLPGSTGPSANPSDFPSSIPSDVPSAIPSDFPSDFPSFTPSDFPSSTPSDFPSFTPSDFPSSTPSDFPSSTPSDFPSDIPSSVPSDSPSTVPSDSPSTVPSDSPSTVPSDSPSTVPSDSPSTVPSDTPSGVPSDAPSSVPSDEPSAIPSAAPTKAPTMLPTLETARAIVNPAPTTISAPTAPTEPAPTPAPTPAPIAPPPSPAPVDPSFTGEEEASFPELECDALSFDLKCRVTEGLLEGRPCNMVGFGVEPCFDRPTAATMRYNGGDCEQSRTRQWVWFDCADSEFGTPPTQEGEESYIVVTDAETRNIVYHSDYVKVGDDYDLIVPGDMAYFETDLYIAIYKTDDTSDQNLLQEVQFNFECKTTTPFVELKNRFGSSQLVSFTNSRGMVDTIVPVSFDLEIEITSGMDESYLLESLTADTNFGDTLDLSSGVANLQLSADTGPLIVPIPVEIDSMRSYQYIAATKLVATEGSSGTRCSSMESSMTRVFGNP